MTDNIDKNEIRKAIDRLQLEHPCHFAFDATKFDSTDTIDVVKRVIDNVMESIRDDADIHIICEFAKLYLDGVKPTIEPKRPHGEWEWKSPTPETIMTPHCSKCGHMNEFLIETNFCPQCGAPMTEEAFRKYNGLKEGETK